EQAARGGAHPESVEGVHVDALIRSGGDQAVELHRRAVALDLRVEAELGLVAADEHVEARDRAVATGGVALEAEIPHVVAEALDAHVPDLRAVAGEALHPRDRDAALTAALGGELLDERDAAPPLGHHDRPEHDGPGPGGPMLLDLQRELNVDAG